MSISRRTLILAGLAAGGGLGVWTVARRLDDGDAATKFAATTPDAVALNAWIKIDPSGHVTCGVHRAEMGQGIGNALAMLVAEELDVDWERMRIEFTPVDRDYYNFGVLLRGQPLGDTAGRPLAQFGERMARSAFRAIGLSMTIGSSSVIDAWDSVRPAAATARALLVAAAARRWSVPADRLETLRGQVLDPVSGRSADYGELAAAAAGEQPPAGVVPKAPSAWRLIGTSPPRLDIPAKVTGTAAFGVDTRLPGMLFAAVRYAPLVGGRIATVDNLAEVAGMPRVEGVVRLGESAVAVVARDSWAALRGAARLSLKPEPEDRPVADDPAILAAYRAALDDPDPAVFRDDGDAPAVIAASDRRVEAEYELPFLAHLCMEPMNATALVDAGAVTVWAPTQAESIARDVAAATAGVAPGNVSVHRSYLGGGFGRRAEMDFVECAVRAAAAFPGRPVNLLYPRSEDLRADRFRPAALARARAALGADGRVVAVDYRLVTQSVPASYFTRTPTPRGGDPRKDGAALSGAATMAYDIPALRCAFSPQDPGVPAGFWRSVGYSHNAFAVESFIDELAAAAGRDPVEFRLGHLGGQPGHQAVLRELASRANWGGALAPGRGRGVALVESHDSIVAQVVEVTVQGEAGGEEVPPFTVDRVVCVIDPRTVVHPDNVVAQVEGAIVDGLSAALYGRVTLRGGGVEQLNFDDYPLLGLAGTPVIEVHLLPQGGRPGGVGEPGLPPVAPALANALFAATGRRFRRLPLKA